MYIWNIYIYIIYIYLSLAFALEKMVTDVKMTVPQIFFFLNICRKYFHCLLALM